MRCSESPARIPKVALSNPALLFLYYRLEQILGIRTTGEALVEVNADIEKRCGYSFVENPAAYECVLSSRERIFDISKTATVNETYFFREGAHFDLLMRHVLPQLARLNRPVRICSAATSIGCEAYSIAMLLDYCGRNGQPLDFEIDAFDICAETIETAKKARYTANTIRLDGANWRYILDLYLTPDGSEYVVSPDIRGKVHFFPHNIMRGLNRQYDIVFFRNALIYFSPKNRPAVLNSLAESLFHNGLLFLGVSETSVARHPLLANRYLSDVFYFQKTSSEVYSRDSIPVAHTAGTYARRLPGDTVKARPDRADPAKAQPLPKRAGFAVALPIRCDEVASILETAEGQPNAAKVLEAVSGDCGGGDAGVSLSGGELAAAVVYFLGIQDYGSAGLALSYLETRNDGPLPLFLRGERELLRGNTGKAERCFEQAAGKEKSFWPAFYRVALLAAEGNRTRYEYKIKKARKSLDIGGELGYECFLGGFSPDYFRRILERKLP
ncbi:MAG: chemotaxis protein CheR [Treponema sp.]|nr:chemotaxis protein CheR [Treponema sp.]